MNEIDTTLLITVLFLRMDRYSPKPQQLSDVFYYELQTKNI